MFGALLGAASSIGGSFMQANAMDNYASNINEALNPGAIARKHGWNRRDIFGRRLRPPDFKFDNKDMFQLLKRLGNYNSRRGSGRATDSAEQINESTIDQLESAMGRLFGGGGAYARLRDGVAANTEDLLAGKLSGSTRRFLGRRAASVGASGIGPGAVDDLYAGFMGTTTEDVVSRGARQFQSLYAGYRQSIPLVTGADLLSSFTLNPAQAIQARIAMAENRYSAELNQELAAAGPDPIALGTVQSHMQRMMAVAGAQLQADSAMASSIAGAGEQLGGLFSGSQSYGFGGGSLGGF